MESKIKAKEILDYCIMMFSNRFNLIAETYPRKEYNEMLKEIQFMMETD